MKIASKPLNFQAIAIEEAETELRLLVKDSLLLREPKSKTDNKARQIIDKALERIKIPSLRQNTRKSLIEYYLRLRREISRIDGTKLLVLLSLIKLTEHTEDSKEITQSISKSRAQAVIKSAIIAHNSAYGTRYDSINIYGVPLQKFSKDYIDRNVKPVLDNLSKQYALDPDDIERRNSLRNKAEMEVRYQSHLDNISELKEQGHRLVIASEHADCSERCRKWQGRVYSLDGTSGVTPDGRKYIPLEKATDVYYTTKTGKRYKNGLLGFNCRHYLVAYKDGFRFPKPDPKVEAKEYKITQKQRYLEREVRHWRTEALMYKTINPERYRTAREKAVAYNNKYIAFSKQNSRAYYPSRTKII